MGGGLMQLVAYGAQDIYLTGNPQITFFKVVTSEGHTDFARNLGNKLSMVQHLLETNFPALSQEMVIFYQEFTSKWMLIIQHK